MGASADDAVQGAHPYLELVLDWLSFELQASLQIIATTVTDVTAPTSDDELGGPELILKSVLLPDQWVGSWP
jgi:hypothetical protein